MRQLTAALSFAAVIYAVHAAVGLSVAESLLLMQGADLAAVQRIMRHQDPRITTEVYGHLAPH
jgi:site-specific recombinase XerD